jgi:hypothetical protein
LLRMRAGARCIVVILGCRWLFAYWGVVAALVLPSWVVPTIDEVRECERVCNRRMQLGADQRDTGVLGAIVWFTLGEVSPISWRTGGPDWATVRAESWSALCLAAGMPGPTVEDWRRLDVVARPPARSDREFAYGVWRTLAWLLGVRADWPTYTAWHRAAGIPPFRPHLHVPAAQRHTEAWRAAERASLDQAESDALRHWRHIRGRADATTQ